MQRSRSSLFSPLPAMEAIHRWSNNSGRHLAAPVPRSTHILYLPPQFISCLHLNSLRQSFPQDMFSIQSSLVIYNILSCSISQQNSFTFDLNFCVLKHFCLFYQETPSHSPIPPIVRMARWPKTAGEFGKCIGADSVRTIKQGRELLCL